MPAPLFLLGAGFNADAVTQAGVAAENRYPLVGDLAAICFNLSQPPNGQSIEALFENAQQNRQREPFERLAHSLMRADYFVAGRLANEPTNAYTRFVERFASSHFLTFNYDSLVEILLFRLGRWRPEDGFGVPVQAAVAFGVNPALVPAASSNQVVHLHGSLCVYAADYEVVQQPGEKMQWLQQRDVPSFIFDPDQIGHRFFPFEAARPYLVYDHTYERMIAPVPNKAEGLTNSFIQASYRTASQLISTSSELISVGYSFNPFDEVSYIPLLVKAAQGGKRLVIVSPDADSSVERLRLALPSLDTVAVPLTFASWFNQGFSVP